MMDTAINARQVLDALLERAKAQEEPELVAKLSEVLGLQSAFELTASPAIADAMVVQLGQLLEARLEHAPHYTGNPGFCVGEIPVRDWIDAYVAYLNTRNKKPQTVKIYKGKITAVLPHKEEPITMEAIKGIAQRQLDKQTAAEARDYNLTAAIKNFFEFLHSIPKP